MVRGIVSDVLDILGVSTVLVSTYMISAEAMLLAAGCLSCALAILLESGVRRT